MPTRQKIYRGSDILDPRIPGLVDEARQITKSGFFAVPVVHGGTPRHSLCRRSPFGARGVHSPSPPKPEPAVPVRRVPEVPVSPIKSICTSPYSETLINAEQNCET